MKTNEKKTQNDEPTNDSQKADAGTNNAAASDTNGASSNETVAGSASPNGPAAGNALRALFEQADTINEQVRAKEAELKELQAKRSAAIKAIFDAAGKKGPFNWQGRQVTVVSRKMKGQDKESWYLREPNDRDAIDVV